MLYKGFALKPWFLSYFKYGWIHTNRFIIPEHISVGDIMVEGYSELLVKFNCEYDKQQETKIRNAWQSLLEKYEKCGIQDDEIAEMLQEDGIHFGIGTN